MMNKNEKKRHRVQMIQVKNALIVYDRLYLLSQIFPNQKNVIIKDSNCILKI